MASVHTKLNFSRKVIKQWLGKDRGALQLCWGCSAWIAVHSCKRNSCCCSKAVWRCRQFVHDPGPGSDEQASVPQNLPSALTHHSLSNLVPQPVIPGATSSERGEGSTSTPSNSSYTMPETLSIPWKWIFVLLGKAGSCVPSHSSGFLIIYKALFICSECFQQDNNE